MNAMYYIAHRRKTRLAMTNTFPLKTRYVIDGDWLVQIIRLHGKGGEEAADGVELVLE